MLLSQQICAFPSIVVKPTKTKNIQENWNISRLSAPSALFHDVRPEKETFDYFWKRFTENMAGKINKTHKVT